MFFMDLPETRRRAMAPVRINYIVSFTSQDDQHKACNLVASDGLKRWLSNRSDRSGKIEVILQLKEPCKLAYVDIGAIWCANLEVRVGRSDWPQSQMFQSLIPTVTLMTPIDCRLGRATTSTQMFSKNDFAEDVANEEWDRLQIICRQPYRKDIQFGLSFINIKSINSVSSLEDKKDESPETLDTMKPRLCTSSIKKHFFGSLADNNSNDAAHAEMLKYRLMKISGSAENGSEQEQSLSRTARLVLKAASNNKLAVPQHKSTSPLPGRGLFSQRVTSKHLPTIEEELSSFFPSLSLCSADVDRVTVADFRSSVDFDEFAKNITISLGLKLRHKFERKKRRKLTKEEKRTFSEMCQNYLWSMFDEKDEGKTNGESKEICGVESCELPTKITKSGKRIASCKPNQREQCQSSDVTKIIEGRDRKQNKARQPKSQMLAATPQGGKALVTTSEVSEASQLQWRTIYCSKDQHVSQDVHHLKKSQVSVVNSGSRNRRAEVSAGPEMSHETEMLDCYATDIPLTSADKLKSVGDTAKETSHFLPITPLLTLKKVNTNTNSSASHTQRDLCTDRSLTVAHDSAADSDGDAEDDSSSKASDVASLSSLSYTDDSEFSDSRTASEKAAAIRLAYQHLYPSVESVIATAETTSASNTASPAKRRKLNRESVEMLMQFVMELSSSDEEGERTRMNSQVSTSVNCAETKTSVKDNIACDNGTISSSSGNKLSNCEESIKPSESNSDKSVKGKLYRMGQSVSKHQQRGSEKKKLMDTENHLTGHNILCPQTSSCDYLSLKEGSTSMDQTSSSSTTPCSSNSQQTTSLARGSDPSATLSDVTKMADSLEAQTAVRQGKKRLDNRVRESRSRASDGGDNKGTPKVWRGTKVEKTDAINSRTRGRERKSLPNVPSDVIVCEKCLGEFSSASFGSHHAFCIPPPSCPSELMYSNDTRELLIDETVDYAECPICMQRFPQDVLLVHASDCGL